MAHPRTLSAAVLPAAVLLLTTCGHDVTAPPTPTQLVFITQPGNLVAGHSFNSAVSVQAEDAQGHKVAGFVGNVTAALANTPGGSRLGGTTTVAAVAGVASFDDLTLDKTGSGYTLTVSASGGGLATPTSAAFDVAPGPATQLAFTVRPTTVTAGAVLAPPLQVSALDPEGNAVADFAGNVTVAFGNNPGASTLAGTTTVAAVSGVARFADLTVAKTGTGYWLTASATGLARAASGAFNVTAGAATQLVFGQQPGTTVADHSITPAVKVQALDALGNLVPGFTGNVSIAPGNNPGGATLSGTTPVAAVAGVASFFDLSLNRTGTGYTLTASAGGLSPVTSVAFDITPGAATQLAFTSQPANAVAGATLSPAVQVTALDPAGNPVPGFTGSVTVAFGNNPGGGTLSGTTTVTALNGVATFGDLRVDKTGTSYWLVATAIGLSKATSSVFGITPGTATQLVFGQQPGTTVANRLFTPAVKVRALDALGNLATGFTGAVAIALGSNPGGATLGGTTPIAAVSGVASFFDLSLSKTGTGYTLVASAGGLGPVTSSAFDIIPGTASQLAFTVQPSNAVAGAAISPAVQVTALDPAGNPVPGFTGNVTVGLGNNPGGSTLGGATTVAAVNGVASFSTLTLDKTGTTYWLRATATGLNTATSAVFSITAGTATQLVFGTQPVTTVANRLITPAVKLRALDALGNLVPGFTGSVSIALGNNPGGATLSGTTPVAAVGGVATFFDLTLNKTGTGYTLTASATGFATVTSTTFDITPGTATQLAFTVPPSNTVAGAAISPAVQVTALDPAGNPVPGFTGIVTVALGNNPGGSTLGGVTNVAAVNGVASYSTLTLDKTGTSYWLTATATGLSTATSSVFAIVAGTATQLVFGQQPVTTVANRSITPAVKVRALDALGNLVPSFTGSVSIALGNNPGGAALSGTTPVAAVGGVATFFDLSLNKTGTGYTLSAGAAALGPVTSAAFDVTPGTATQLAFTAQPTSAVAGAVISPAVQVTALDPAGNVVPSFSGSVTMAFGNNPGGSTLGGTTTVAAVNGVASFGDLTADKTSTGYWLRATATGLSAATSADFAISPGAATQLVWGTQPAPSTVADNLISPAVKVRALDAFGNIATDFNGAIAVALGSNPGGATLSGTTPMAAVNGIATFFLSINKVGSGYTLTASATGFSAVTSRAFDVIPGTATHLAFTQQPSTTVAGGVISPALQVTALDPAGNPVPSFTGEVTVALGNNSGGSTLGGATTVAAVNGVATFSTLTLDKTGTGYWLTVSATGLSATTSSIFAITPGPATQLVFGTQPGTTVADNHISPTVKVRALDAFGNLATGFGGTVAIALGSNPGGATLSGTPSVAAVNGIASFDLSVNKTGTGYTLVASATGFTAVTSAAFDIIPGTATQLAFSVQPSNTVAGEAINPAVLVSALDPAGNFVPGFTGKVTVAFGNNPGGSTLSGTTTVAAVNGVARFWDLSADKTGTSYWLTATASGLNRATSGVFDVAAGAATQLVFGTEPGTTVADHQITPAVKVRALDGFGNLATGFSGAVAIALGNNPGGATLSGTTPVAAVGGVATFFLAINKAGSGYTLTASVSGLATVTSTAFDITPGSATQLAFTVQPASTVAGVAISPAIQVSALDPAGNLVPGFTGSVTMTFGNNPGGSTLGGTTTVAVVNGVASFGDLSANKTGTSYWLTATATGLSSATSNVFNVIAGPATQLVFGQQPGTITGGTIFNPAVKVRALDALGNLATGFAGDVTMALGVNPGGRPLDGTTTVTAAGGVAIFFELSVARANTGYTLTAAAAGLTGVESVPFDVLIGPASHLDFQTRPHDEIAGAILGNPYVQLRGEDAGGNLDTTFTGLVTVVLSDNPGGGTLSGATTVAAVHGLATFFLSIDKAASGYTLTFSSAGLLSVTSFSFTITPATASQLAFTVQPTNTAAGGTITPAVEVTARDAFGNVATGFSGNVTLAIGSNPAGGTLSGTTTVTAAAGLARFTALSIDKVGVGYTLVAGSGGSGLAGATSVTFDIH